MVSNTQMWPTNSHQPPTVAKSADAACVVARVIVSAAILWNDFQVDGEESGIPDAGSVFSRVWGRLLLVILKAAAARAT